MTKKILIITDNYVGEPGGSEKHLLNLLSGISTDFHVTVFQMYPDKLKTSVKDARLAKKQNVELKARPVKSVFSLAYFKLVLKLWILIYRQDIELVISYHEKADLLNFVLKMLVFKKVVHLSSKRDMGFNISNRLKKLMKFITCRLDGVVSPSTSIKELMQDEYGVASDHAWVIHNGTNLDLYHRGSTEEVKQLRQQLQLPVDKKIIGCVGTLKPIKGHQFLLQGYANFIKNTQADTLLVLIGGGEEEGNLTAQVKALGLEDHVMLAGWQKNVPDWIRAIDVFVISSLSEGLSNALVEASAAGLPLLATQVGGNSEVVVPNENGLLIESGSAEAIEQGLTQLFQDDSRLQQYGDRSRQLAEEKFSNASMVKHFENLFSQRIEAERSHG